MVPGEICMGRSERSNRGHTKKAALNMQKSAEAIVAGQSVKGRINRSLEYDRERRDGLECRKQERKLPAKG